MVLEVHRALHHNGNVDVTELRKKEAELRRQLQVPAAAAAARAVLSGVAWADPAAPAGWWPMLRLRFYCSCISIISARGPAAGIMPPGICTSPPGVLAPLLPPPAAAPAPAPPPQDIQRDLNAAQKQRQLTEAEAAQLSAINQRLSAENASLAATADSLKARRRGWWGWLAESRTCRCRVGQRGLHKVNHWGRAALHARRCWQLPRKCAPQTRTNCRRVRTRSWRRAPPRCWSAR